MPHGARWRVVQADNQAIGFLLRRSRRRTVGLAVNEDGLTVTAPAWVTLAQIDDAVRDKASWVLAKLALHRERSQRLAMAETQWQAGGRIPYLGVQLVLAPDARHRHTHLEGRDDAPEDGNMLHLALPADADRDRLRDAAHAWLQQRAERWLDARLKHYVSLQGSSLHGWRLSAAATRWGSCSSDGRIMLNWRLIHFHPDIIDYVVAHEVAHLKHMNHSPDFWRQVEWLCPDFPARRDALRAHRPGSLPLL